MPQPDVSPGNDKTPHPTGRPSGAGRADRVSSNPATPAPQALVCTPKYRQSSSALIGVVVGTAILLAVVIAALTLNESETHESPATTVLSDVGPEVPANTKPAVSSTAEQAPPAKATPDLQGSQQPAITEVDDDGKTLWASPTAGEPVSLDYLPSGVQVFLVFRPAELLANAEGVKLFDALGPAGELAKSQLRSILGIDLSEVEQLTIGFFPDEADLPQATFVARLRTAVPEVTLLKAWSNPATMEHHSKQYFQGPRWAYYLPAAGAGRVLAIAPPTAMKEILELDGPPPVPKGIERLLRNTDRERHFNLIAAPSYLLTDGKSLLLGDLERLRDPLANFLDQNVEAVLLSAHLGNELFLEFRGLGTVDKSPQDLANLLGSRLERVPEQVELYAATLAPRPYGRLVVNRFPRMVQLVRDFTRSGVENKQAVLRAYLPLQAAHNLLLGAELTLFEQPASSLPTASPSVAKPGVQAALAKRISLSFPRDTLERCLELLSKEIDVPVVILGPDLQLEGITKNQSFALDERDAVAEEILLKVLKLANPDGKLVYVIRENQGRSESIAITTRKAATKRGDRLPAVFGAKSSSEKP